MYSEVKQCRICGNSNLVEVLDLGEQYLTGVFPSRKTPSLSSGPLQLVKCIGSDPRSFCGLVQLRYSFDAKEMYGDTYGYRSGLNPSMVDHLHRKVEALQELIPVGPEDFVLDIGSNDGTLLARYSSGGPTLFGIDPSASKFQRYYRPDMKLIVDFFSANVFLHHSGGQKAKIVTSIAMFYDLEEPQAFVNDIASVLAADGVWHLEQSYLPSMLRTNSYDTACHEHVEYYALRQLDWMVRRVGLRIIDVELNNINGGSFAVTIGKESSNLRANEAAIEALAEDERVLALDTLQPFEAFWKRVLRQRDELLSFFSCVQQQKQLVIGYGASTKGNVLLQFCGITPDMLPCIGEINEDKFGCVTPGTWIPIVPESEARALNPDYFLVLPWHFRNGIVKREAGFLARGGKIVFPLPNLDVLSE
jgi:NDP-4-keto-2,6-dideoxyhexose 3-C-methyltransferase